MDKGGRLFYSKPNTEGLTLRTYDNGKKFSSELVPALREQYERVNLKHKASLIIIDGGIGEGKTTLALEGADEINEFAGLPEVDVKGAQYAFGGKEFTAKLRQCYEQKLPVIIYDEAGDFNKRAFLSRFNQMLNRTFETFRAFKIVVILCLPSFNVLDNDLFDKQIPRLLLHCENRTNEYGNFKAYGLYRMSFVRFYMSKIVNKPYAYVRVIPNFRGHFLDLEPARASELDKVSVKKKIESLFKSEIALEGLLSLQDLQRELSCSYTHLRKLIKEAKIKPSRIIKGKTYYLNDVLERLLNRES